MSDPNDAIQNKVLKFDNYDIFGFIIPGVVLAIGFFLHTKMFETNEFNVKLVNFFSSIKPASTNMYNFTSLSLVGLCCLYILGHIAALWSSALIDKLLVARTKGYPFRRLFNETIPALWYPRRMAQFYKSIIFLFALPMSYISIKGVHDLRILFLFAPCILLLVSKIIMSALYLRQIDNPYKFRTTDDWHRKIADFLWKYFFKKSLHILANYCFDLFSKGALSAFKMYKPYTKDFQNMFIKKFKQTFKINPCEIDTEIYWLTRSYLCQNSPKDNELIERWLTLYSFARNLAGVFMLLFFYNIVLNEKDNPNFIYWNLSTMTGFMIFLMRYYHLYYDYYSKYLFRAFVTL
ncbi:MAG: hypothetical protein KAQ89_05435 [Planctomycetes bacterium]|nr:hypothetical protein [Planctomycetota bacterium]MCK5614481.1 hypothetical protein [Candidatus Pacearchaeota archaeon]